MIFNFNNLDYFVKINIKNYSFVFLININYFHINISNAFQ